MINKKIETLAINAVRDSIVKTDLLDEYISDHDKEPSWDGNIYIYKNKSRKKENITGRVPAQVKGTVKKDFSKTTIKFPVLISDLNNYLNDGGVIYFVVYMDEMGDNKTIYYIDLTPIRIRTILKDTKNNKKISINFHKFPTNSNDIISIVLNCYQNCTKQSSFSKAKLPTIKELENNGLLEGITLSLAKIGGNDIITTASQEGYLYAKVKGSAIPQPIEAVIDDYVLHKTTNTLVRSGNTIFYDKIKTVRDKESKVTYIGDSFILNWDEKNHLVKINYKATNQLRQLSNDLDFMLSVIKNKGFYLNSTFFPFDSNCANLSNFDIKKQQAILVKIRCIIEVLDKLNCKKDIDIQSLSDVDWKNLDVLIKAFVDNIPVSELREDINNLLLLKIGNLHFLLIFLSENNTLSTKRVYDFFNFDYPLLLEIDNEKYMIPQYSILKAQDLLIIENLQCDVMLPAFKSIKRHPELIGTANTLMLELIKAYDLDNQRKEFLETADDFAHWIMETSTEQELPYQIRLLNQLQIKKRKDELSEVDIKMLYDIIENPIDCREDIIVGAYILLGQSIPAKLHFEKMSDKLKKEFPKYPIYNLLTEF